MAYKAIFTVGLLALTFSQSVFSQYNGLGYKVAVFDSGVMTSAGFNPSIFDEQLCVSRADELTSDSVQGFIPDKVSGVIYGYLNKYKPNET